MKNPIKIFIALAAAASLAFTVNTTSEKQPNSETPYNDVMLQQNGGRGIIAEDPL